MAEIDDRFAAATRQIQFFAQWRQRLVQGVDDEYLAQFVEQSELLIDQVALLLDEVAGSDANQQRIAQIRADAESGAENVHLHAARRALKADPRWRQYAARLAEPVDHAAHGAMIAQAAGVGLNPQRSATGPSAFPAPRETNSVYPALNATPTGRDVRAFVSQLELYSAHIDLQIETLTRVLREARTLASEAPYARDIDRFWRHVYWGDDGRPGLYHCRSYGRALTPQIRASAEALRERAQPYDGDAREITEIATDILHFGSMELDSLAIRTLRADLYELYVTDPDVAKLLLHAVAAEHPYVLSNETRERLAAQDQTGVRERVEDLRAAISRLRRRTGQAENTAAHALADLRQSDSVVQRQARLLEGCVRFVEGDDKHPPRVDYVCPPRGRQPRIPARNVLSLDVDDGAISGVRETRKVSSGDLVATPRVILQVPLDTVRAGAFEAPAAFEPVVAALQENGGLLEDLAREHGLRYEPPGSGYAPPRRFEPMPPEGRERRGAAPRRPARQVKRVVDREPRESQPPRAPAPPVVAADWLAAVEQLASFHVDRPDDARGYDATATSVAKRLAHGRGEMFDPAQVPRLQQDARRRAVLLASERRHAPVVSRNPRQPRPLSSVPARSTAQSGKPDEKERRDAEVIGMPARGDSGEMAEGPARGRNVAHRRASSRSNPDGGGKSGRPRPERDARLTIVDRGAQRDPSAPGPGDRGATR